MKTFILVLMFIYGQDDSALIAYPDASFNDLRTCEAFAQARVAEINERLKEKWRGVQVSGRCAEVERL